jgi:FixJ family two-component response regulator
MQHVSAESTAVYVIDDDASVRTAMGRLLRSASYTVYEFPSAEAFLSQCSMDTPGCLLLDLKMPSVSGLDLVEVLERGESPFTAVLMTGVGDIQDSVKAMKLGAVDFLTKPLEESQILASVQSAMRLSWQRYWARNEKAKLQQLFDTLTPRERQVCELVSLGLPNKQTALRLGASEKTVKIHRGRVMSKLAVNSVAELVRFVDRLQPGARRSSPETST